MKIVQLESFSKSLKPVRSAIPATAGLFVVFLNESSIFLSAFPVFFFRFSPRVHNLRKTAMFYNIPLPYRVGLALLDDEEQRSLRFSCTRLKTSSFGTCAVQLISISKACPCFLILVFRFLSHKELHFRRPVFFAV